MIYFEINLVDKIYNLHKYNENESLKVQILVQIQSNLMENSCQIVIFTKLLESRPDRVPALS